MTEEQRYKKGLKEAERLAEETGRPQVVIEWSEHRDLDSGSVYEFGAANELLNKLNGEHTEDGYYKTKLSVFCLSDGTVMHYDACRYDIGDERGDLLYHIKEVAASPYGKYSEDDRNFLQRFITALDDYMENRQDEQEVKAAPVYVDGVSFAAQVDAVLSGADTSSTHLKVMTTPLLLREAGARNLPVLMTARHLKSIVQESGTDSVNYHGLGADLVKRLPELLSDPVMIMDSLTRDDSVVLVTTTTDKQQHPVIAALKFDGIGNLDNLEIEANIITSVYGKENFNNFIANNASAKTVIYWNKEKSQELTKTPGIQFPDNLSSLASNTIIRKARAFVNGSTENFTQSEQNAKPGQAEPAEQVEQSGQPGQTKPSGQERNVASATKPAEKKKSLNEEVNAARSELVKDLVARMEKGDLAWRHFASLARPHNGADKRLYTGANVINLWCVMERNGWEDPRFYTFNQANAAGYRVKKGERSSRIELWKCYDKKEKKSVDSVKELRKKLEEQGLTAEQVDEYFEDNVTMSCKMFNVFNGQQLEGIDKWQGIQVDETQRNERCQEIITFAPVTIKQDTQTRAYYSPAEDTVHLPTQFDSYPAFYDTAFHEIGHATGHTSRLNRDMGGGFGSPSYAREELVAELTSVFMQSDLGVSLTGRQLDNNAAYLQAWLRACIDKPNDFFSAVRDAEKAAEFVQTAVKEKMEQSTDARNKAIANYYKQRRENTRRNLQANVPAEMKALKQWCVFRTYKDENGKRSKRNLSVYTGSWASVSDPGTWCTFDEALKYAAEHDCEGLTFVLTKDAGIHCIDLDECAGKRGGQREPMSDEARRFVGQAQGAYMESSVSGTGVHIFFKGDMPDLKHTVGKGTPEGELEFYSDRKFISMTGNISQFDFPRVEQIATFDRNSELAAHLAGRLGEQPSAVDRKPRQTTLAELTDNEVVDLLNRSKAGEDFKRLMAGEDICGDHSRSDFRLMSMLAFATGNNSEQMQRLFESSGLYRPDKKDAYVIRTAEAAIRSNRSQYSPRQTRKGGKGKGKGKGKA